MSRVYLLLGSNIGNRKETLRKANKLIAQNTAVILSSSGVYESAAWGFKSNNYFLNQVLLIETEYSPQHLLSEILNIENILGRVRKSKHYESRVIDIDILLYDDKIVEDINLKIPHPQLHKRNFALVPLVEIAGEFIHPGFKKTIKEILEECNDNLWVKIQKE
jgi:2-amino-4-hydroxy-6-hydroxymethyldihydropteridine diphosphokinase